MVPVMLALTAQQVQRPQLDNCVQEEPTQQILGFKLRASASPAQWANTVPPVQHLPRIAWLEPSVICLT